MTTYNLLVLEDDKDRMKKIRSFLTGFTFLWCRTASEAINALSNTNNHFDIVSLDHDLADDHYIKPVENGDLIGTGQDVADWIAYNKPDIQFVIIHSLNPAGGKNMQRVLERHAVEVIYHPGCWNLGSFYSFLNYHRIEYNKDGDIE
jgi:CheY-like chemotaxis protein